jgi:glucosylglycerate synthase
LRLPEESILSDDFLRELMNVGEVDILVGVPTYNDARTVGQVVQAVREGLLKFFPRQRSVIINADGGSRDGTQELVRAASINDLQHASRGYALRTLHCISTQYPGGAAAAGNGLHAILEAGDLLRATACAVISPDSTSIAPEWLDRLLRPVMRDNFDLVTPLYRRHKFDGLLVRNLIYPMTRALYGHQVREPYPSEFAFSNRLAGHLLSQDIWSEDAAGAGAEMCLTASAMAGGFRLVQSFLGDKPRADHAPADLVRAMRQTVGSLFWMLDQTFPVWSASANSKPVPAIGEEQELTLEPLRVNRKRLHQMFVSGVSGLEPVLKSILTASTLAALERIAGVPEAEFCYPDELWVQTVYEFAASHHKAVISRDHIVQALAPLYRGKTHTFLAVNRDASGSEVENNVEALCRCFEQLKPYLLELWDGRK